jgi:hypothetical protein
MEILIDAVFLFQLPDQPTLATNGITMIGIAAILGYLRDQKRLFKMSLIFLFIIASTVALFFLTDRYEIYRHQLMVPGRYLLIATFFWALLLMGWLEGCLIKHDGLQRFTAIGIAAVIVLVVVTNEVRHEKGAYAMGTRGQRVAIFTRAIKHYEDQAQTWEDRYIQLRLGKRRRRFQPSVTIGNRSPTAVNVGALPGVDAMPFEQYIVRP